MSSKDKFAGSGGERRQVAMIAVAWFVRMRSAEKTPEEERRFRAWLAENEGHAAAYDSIEQAWDQAGDVEAVPGFQAIRQEALRQRPGFFGRHLRSATRRAPVPRPRSRAGWSMAAAAVSVLAVTVIGLSLGTWMPGARGDHSYQTTAGQRTTITLADGSVVTLTSHSRLSAEFSEQTRRVVLSRGEAYFDVAHDPRPFRVQAGSGTVTALGTEFDVYKKNGEVVVTLVEGRVKVAALNRAQREGRNARELEAGERVSYDETGLMGVRRVNVAQAVSWREGRIQVSDEPLLNVIDEMNRHSKRQLKVDRSDRRLRNLLVTGRFKTGRPERLVQYIRNAGIRVWVTKDGEGNVTLRLRGRR